MLLEIYKTYFSNNIKNISHKKIYYYRYHY